MDALLSLEAEFRREGESAGFKRGAQLGRTQGRAAGYTEGSRRALERNFSLGVAHAVQALAEAHPECLSIRACNAASALERLATEYRMEERGNDGEKDIDALQEALKHQLRLTLALARLPPLRAPLGGEGWL